DSGRTAYTVKGWLSRAGDAAMTYLLRGRRLPADEEGLAGRVAELCEAAWRLLLGNGEACSAEPFHVEVVLPLELLSREGHRWPFEGDAIGFRHPFVVRCSNFWRGGASARGAVVHRWREVVGKATTAPTVVPCLPTSEHAAYILPDPIPSGDDLARLTKS